MAKTARFKVAQVGAALEVSGGIRCLAAQKLGCSPQTVTNYIDRHPQLAELVTRVIESNLDLAEAQLLKAISEGNLTAVIFYLKTKGKARGYTERSEITGADGKPVQVSGPVIMVPPESHDDMPPGPAAAERQEG